MCSWRMPGPRLPVHGKPWAIRPGLPGAKSGAARCHELLTSGAYERDRGASASGPTGLGPPGGRHRRRAAQDELEIADRQPPSRKASGIPPARGQEARRRARVSGWPGASGSSGKTSTAAPPALGHDAHDSRIDDARAAHEREHRPRGSAAARARRGSRRCRSVAAARTKTTSRRARRRAARRPRGAPPPRAATGRTRAPGSGRARAAALPGRGRRSRRSPRARPSQEGAAFESSPYASAGAHRAVSRTDSAREVDGRPSALSGSASANAGLAHGPRGCHAHGTRRSQHWAGS